ncbi:MAG: hypothetical protein WA821_03875 [Anaerolineales bacterium]
MSPTRNRHHKKTPNDNIEQLKQQMKEEGILSDERVVLVDAEGPKISEVFLEFIEPYEKDAPTDEAFEKLLVIAVMAWNAAVLGAEEGQELIDVTVGAIAKSAGQTWGEEAKGIIAAMIERKQNFFADDNRYIMDYRWAELEDGHHLTMAALIKDQDSEQFINRTTLRSSLD